MALPLILSVLGSTAAGAGLLGTLSPLIAGSLGAGIGTTLQGGSLQDGIRAGLTSGLLGGLGGIVAGNFAGGAGTAAATGALGAAPAAAAPAAGVAAAAPAAGAAAGATGAAAQQTLMQRLLNADILRNMQPGFVAGPAAAPGTPLTQQLVAGLGGHGAMSGAGIGTALGASMAGPRYDMGLDDRDTRRAPEAQPYDRRRRDDPPPWYQPGRDAEYYYFNPRPTGATRYAGGGSVAYRMPGMRRPIRMAAGGVADALPGATREPNDKDLVRMAVSAVRGEIDQQEAAIVLGMFIEKFGEDALRQLVRDVRSGKANQPRRDNLVEGAGDGMSDTVPATMTDAPQDVLLSDGEFVVPADVVSGLGNGSTDAGAAELNAMMDRVRGARTGTAAQPPRVAAGGLLPA